MKLSENMQKHTKQFKKKQKKTYSRKHIINNNYAKNLQKTKKVNAPSGH